MPGRITHPLRAEHLLESFVCERGPDLVSFLMDRAVAFDRSGCGRTYVLLRDEEDEESAPQVLGYYTLAMGSAQLPADLQPDADGLPSKFPVALICQLARDDRADRGIGVWLLADAFRRILRVRQEIGCVGIALHAQNEGLEQYYQNAGFQPIASRSYPRPRLMFVDARAVEQSLAEAETG
jgi:hypothetical protein